MQHKPFSEQQAQRNERKQPANRITAINRKRFTHHEVEAEINRRRNFKTYYENR